MVKRGLTKEFARRYSRSFPSMHDGGRLNAERKRLPSLVRRPEMQGTRHNCQRFYAKTTNIRSLRSIR